MKTKSLDLVRSTPGIHVVVMATLVFFVEVEPGGRCWQLDPHDFSRDGELDEERWCPTMAQRVVAICGPLRRVES